MAKNVYITTIRLSKELYEDLSLIARTEGKTISYMVREAVSEYIERRKADSEFQARLRARIEADQRILRKLAET